MVELTVFRHQRETEAVVGKSLQGFLLILRQGALCRVQIWLRAGIYSNDCLITAG